VFRLPEWVKYSVVGTDNLVVERQGDLTQIVLPSQLSGESFSVTLKCTSSQAGSFPLMARITAAKDIQTDYVNESIFYFQTLLPETISEPVKFQPYFKEAFTHVYQDKWLGISTKPASHADIPWLNPFPGHLVEIDLKNGSTKSLLELDESLNRIYFDHEKDLIVAYSNHATSLGVVRNYIEGDPELVGFWDWSDSAELEGFTVMGAIPDPYFNNRIIIALTQFNKERMGDYEFKILVWNIETERFLPMKIELDNASIQNSGLDFYQRVRLIPSPVQNRILVINKFNTYSSIVYYKLSLQGLEKVDQTIQINGSIAEFPDMDYQPKGDRIYWYNGMVFNLETNTQEEELWPELVDSIFNTEYFLLAPTEAETFSLVSNYYNPNFPDNIVESEITISFRNFHDGSIIKELEMDFPFNKINEPFFIPDLGFVMHLVDGSGVFLFGPEYLDRVIPIISDFYLNLASGADGNWFLEFHPQPGFQYQIQSSWNLEPNSWEPLIDSITGDSPVQVPVQLMEDPMRYFRLRREE
jgi:hypothetical protein